MSVAIGVVAHWKRADMAQALAEQVSASFVSVDDGTLGAEANHLQVWKHLADMGTTHCCVLEDDAVPVDGFRDQLDQAIEVAPAPVVSLYLGRSRPPQWQPKIYRAIEKADDDTCWIVGTHLLHAVGVVIPTDLVQSMTSHRTNLPIDQSISLWARVRGHRVAYTVPSLVDHLDGPTLIQHPDGKPRPAGRVAWQVGTRNKWTDKAVNL
ncbi:hypothetical protein PXH78_33115 [Mycolicibacterium smegmatis]|uniref:hypothetical protein n=1 Tax=Mycolicibacterium smegmatis TaxID=1772 RepID=UPI0005DA176C|nr:hypothetical protein [Mycolicibacterium smegmatis]MDF1899076.1 hypothetical protein [Mycolicibacterium smegmatis]MDF1904900.1 hypothetical protein [Mycolicibacterium smegmatis]MDF1922133.1 hypothetical protein [Mycolicibacterium smegmatis]MDF1928703.1 hypothetical protein [Mycolicibacterium smegmatis]UAK53351.1 hypothetical protein K8P01_22425 [Mycolicibacterium smegmatis]